MTRLLMFLLLLLLVIGAAAAQAPAVDPDAERPVVGPEMNSYYHGADYEQWRDIFESSGREVFDKRLEITAALRLAPGMRVADVGAGTGLYTMLFADAVGGDGRVYAVDISQEFVESIAERAAAAGAGNVVAVQNHQKSTKLPPDSVDLVFMADTYHHFEYPGAMLASMHQALSDDGKLAIIDFRRMPGISNAWIMSHVRAGRQQVINEVQAAGFDFVGEPLKLRGNYFLLFRKRPL